MVDVKLDGITKTFGPVTAVDNVSLRIQHGEFLFLLGPSGCGKTTLLRVIAGFERADTGRLFFGEKESTNIPPVKRNIGMVFQNYALFPHMTVYQNVEFGLRVRGIDPAERRKRIMRALEQVKMGGLEGRYPRQLSGGQQQRAALARAIVIDPDILLLDEPLGALDRKLRVDMQLELKLLQKELQVTTVFVTHDQEEALTMADRIAVMRDGHIEQLDAPLKIYEHPASSFVANFIGQTNYFDGEVASVGPAMATVSTREGPAISVLASGWTQPGWKGILAIRPEKIRLSPTRLPEYENAIPGRVQNSLYMGDKTHYFVDIGQKTLLVFQQNLATDVAPFPPGSEVLVHFDCRSVLALPAAGEGGVAAGVS